MTRFPLNQQRGRRAEEDAHRYLCERGLTPVMRNFRCRVGEIDLIMRDGRHLVFVEVRYRRRSDFGDGADSV
ncbi:MAG TPA: YraN family protein, partial [Gammaproteobacteria bacterium]|nr:YraN family protein [Gammaproteobacteria bacterium]